MIMSPYETPAGIVHSFPKMYFMKCLITGMLVAYTESGNTLDKQAD